MVWPLFVSKVINLYCQIHIILRFILPWGYWGTRLPKHYFQSLVSMFSVSDIWPWAFWLCWLECSSCICGLPPNCSPLNCPTNMAIQKWVSSFDVLYLLLLYPGNLGLCPCVLLCVLSKASKWHHLIHQTNNIEQLWCASHSVILFLFLEIDKKRGHDSCPQEMFNESGKNTNK